MDEWRQCRAVRLVFAERADQKFAGELPCQLEDDHTGPHAYSPDPNEQ